MQVGQGFVRHRGGATLILDASGAPTLIVRQRVDNDERLESEARYTQTAIQRGLLILDGEEYVVNDRERRALC